MKPACRKRTTTLTFAFQFDYGPASRLVSLYERDHRLEDARRVLLNFDKTQPSDSSIGYPVDYLKQMRFQSLGNAAAKLLDLGFAADAVLLYNQAIGAVGRNRTRRTPVLRRSARRGPPLQRRLDPRIARRHPRRAGLELVENARR